MTKSKVEDINNTDGTDETVSNNTEDVPQPRKRGRPRKIRLPESDSAYDKGSKNPASASRKNTRQDVKKKMPLPPPVHIVCDDATYYFGQDDEAKQKEAFLDMTDARDAQLSNLFQKGACFTGSIATRFEELTKLEHHIAELLLQITVQSEYLLKLSDSTEPSVMPGSEESNVHRMLMNKSATLSPVTESCVAIDSPSKTEVKDTNDLHEKCSPHSSESIDSRLNGEQKETLNALQVAALQDEIKNRIRSTEIDLMRFIEEKICVVNIMKKTAQEMHTESCNLHAEMLSSMKG